MKKRSLLTILVMLSVLLVGIGTAHARLSANDFVPGQDVVVMLVCEGTLDGANNPIFGSLNTNIAIAEKDDGSALAPPNQDFVVEADLTVYDPLSKRVYDDKRWWSKYDVVADNCQDMVLDAPAANRPQMRIDMPLQGGGVIHLFAGYAVYRQAATTNNRFIPWAYLIDLNKGFSSGFNGISAEDGVGLQLGEDGGNRPVTAHSLFPRFFLLNGLPDTWNWWMLLLGRNELTLVNPIQYTTIRHLSGYICDEEELCRSIDIHIPWELNIIDVLGNLHNDIKTACGFPANPCGGFARLTISETGSRLFPTLVPITITGTANDSLPLVSPPNFYSAYGLSYQRAADSSATLSWDAIHEIHRIYCSSTTGETGVVQGVGNELDCPVSLGM